MCVQLVVMCVQLVVVCVQLVVMCVQLVAVCVQFSTGVHVPMSQMYVLCNGWGTDCGLCDLSRSPQSFVVSGEECELICLFHGWL